MSDFANIGYDILLITKMNWPYIGKFAFPGDFLNYNEEPVQGCLRVLKE